ncbi:MAG: peptidoglycan-binding domain-containing protein [Patescibacteria group bacterium]|nr:peptidoglycan-binding domain-containing protein [Patescibacteria group bacterium]
MSTKRIIAGVTTATCATMMIASSFVPAFALTIEELEAQIALLQAQLAQYQDQLDDVDGDVPAAPVAYEGIPDGFTFDNALYYGMTSDEVKYLQIVLKADIGAPTYPDSVGATGWFGPISKSSVIAFQEKYSDDVLASWGLTSGTGYVGSTTRDKLNELLSAGTTPVPPAPDPIDASDFDNEADCDDAGFYWYDDVCNEAAQGSPSAAGLTVAVANTNPVATTYADGSAYNDFLKLKFTAGAEGDVEVSGLTVTKGGISADTYVEGISLVDSNDNRHGVVITSLDSYSQAALTFSDDPLVVPAGESIYATVQINIGSGFGSGTINMKIDESGDVVSDASSVSGSFPLVGNTMSVVDGASTIGGLYVDAVQFHNNATDDDTDVNVNLGTVDQIVSKFKFTESAASANEDVQIEKITIYNNGNTTDADIANIDLVAPDGTVLSTLESLSGKYGTFDLSSSPYVIPDGSNKTLTVRCDIVKGSTRTVRFLIENDYDVVVTGASSDAGILAAVDTTTGNNAGDHTFPVGDRLYHATASSGRYINKITIASGSLSVSKSTASPSGNIAVGATNQTLAEFKLTSSGEDMRLDKIRVCITIPNASYELAGTLKLQDENDVTLWSLAASTNNLYSTGTCTQYNLTSRKTIPANTSENLKIVGDIKTTATTSYTYQVAIRDLYARRMSTGDYVTYSSGSDVSANTLTVDTSALTLAKNDAYGNNYGVAGSAKVKIASYIIQAGSAEAINISSFKATLGTFGTGEVGDYSNLIVEKGDGTQLGSTVVSPAAAGDTLSVSGFQVAASGSETINVFADLSSDAAADETVVVTLGDFGATGATSATTITTPSDTTGQTLTWAASGALAVSTDTATPSVATLHASESDTTVLKFILSSTYELIDVNKIILDSTYGAANISNVKLYDGSTLLGSASLLSGKVTFSGLSLEVPKDGSKYLTVKISTTGSGTLKSAESLGLMVESVESTGSGSGVVIYPSAVTTAASAGIADEDTQAITVTSTTDFAVGDVILVYNATNGVEWGMVISIDSATQMTVSTEDDMTVKAARISRVASPITTAASAGTALEAGAAITVTSSAGFAVGDAVLVYNITDGVELGMVTVMTDSTTMTINTENDMTASATRVTKISGSASTAASAGTVLAAGVAITATSTTGFAAGDVVLVYNSTDGVELGMVVSVASATAMTISSESDMSAAAARVVKLATFTTTAASAGIPLDTGAAVTVTSNNGFAVGDVVAVYNATDGVEIGMVSAITGSTSITINTKADMTAAAVRVSELWSSTGTGNPYVVHDVEPTLALNSGSPTSGSPATLETVAKFDITANGTRDLKIESINFYRGGSVTTQVAVGSAPKVYVGSTLLGTGANWGSAAAGAASNVDFTSPYTITAGNTVTFEVKVNTSSITTVNATFQLYIDGTAGVKTAANAAVDWYYIAASPSPGTEPTEASPASYCDEYAVYGNSLRY